MDVIEAIGKTPLIELKRVASGLPNRVFIKCEHLNPGGSVKDRTARAIILDAEARGVLVPHRDPAMTIVEGTAGNTGVGLALVAASRGYRCVCVLPERVAVDKRVALRQLGAEVYVAKAAGIKSPDNFRNVAARLAEERGWFLTNQFHNPANLDAHYGGKDFSATGPEILQQMDGKLAAFVSSAGTGGTITGVGKYLKERVPGVAIVLADPIGSGLGEWVNTGELGPDGPFAVEGIGSASVPSNLHRAAMDFAEKVADTEAFAMVERLAKEEGLTVGGSTGVNVVAALRVAARAELSGPVVTVAADLWDRYRSTAWMKSWEAREAEGLVFMQPQAEAVIDDPTRWVPATPDGLLRGVARALERCTIELACKPYLVTASNMFAAADGADYERFVTSKQFVPWSDRFLEMIGGIVPGLAIGAAKAGGRGAEDRFFAAVAYVLELSTRGETADGDRTEAIASGAVGLDAALRECEVARLARAVERARDQLDGPPPADLDPTAVAELARANVLRVDDLKIPIPSSARNQPEGLTAFSPDGDGTATADFTWSSGPTAARAFYTTWARKARWLVELDAGEDTGTVHRLRLARDDRKIELLIVARSADETMLTFRLRARGPVIHELSERD